MRKLHLPKTAIVALEREMSEETNDDNGLGLEQIIQSISDDIVKSQRRIEAGSGRHIFFVEKATITLSVTVKRTMNGKVKLVAVEGGGDHETQQLHQVTLELNTKPPLLDKVFDALLAEDKDKALSFVAQFEQKAGE